MSREQNLTISAAEIQSAGGLDKWLAKQNKFFPPKTGSGKGYRKGQTASAKIRLPDPVLGADACRMNKLEKRYALWLEELRERGTIKRWRFEGHKLRLAQNTWYTPDFLVIPAISSRFEFHEVKGFWRDDARVKIKIAARMFEEYDFYAVQQFASGGWVYECFTQPFTGKNISPEWLNEGD